MRAVLWVPRSADEAAGSTKAVLIITTRSNVLGPFLGLAWASVGSGREPGDPLPPEPKYAAVLHPKWRKSIRIPNVRTPLQNSHDS